jgi:hypothetical protein
MNTTEEPKRITVWLEPDSKINSEYGLVTCWEWCRLECQRIGHAEVAISKTGDVAVRVL